MGKRKTVMITGAAGNLGTKLARHLKGRYDLTLLDRTPLSTDENGRLVQFDLSQWHDDLALHFENVDVVVHLAANPNDLAEWEPLISTNLDATINVFIAAARARVSRLIYASSNHVMGGYKEKRGLVNLPTDRPPIPGTRYTVGGTEYRTIPYGSMKLFGERLGKCFADSSDMTVVAVRIGWVRSGENRAEDMPADADDWFKAMWLSNRDFCHLMERCMLADLPERFTTINGMSRNSPMVWDIEEAKRLVGFDPQDGLTV